MHSKILYNFQTPTHFFPKTKPTAIYIKNARIQAIGPKEEIFLQYGRPTVEKIDLQGGYLTPGLVDSHLHLSLLGQKLLSLDLSGISSKKEFLKRVKEATQKTPSGKWIVGQGWCESEFQGEIPTLAELDQIAPHHPLLLIRVCHHVYLANTLAAKMAGVRPHVEDPEEGKYGRDGTGRWDGQIYENASFPFHQAIPEPSKAEKKAIIRQAMQKALESGLTAVHTEDMRLVKDAALLVEIMRELQEEGVFLRTHHLIYHPYLEQVADPRWREQVQNNFFQIGAIKLFADGSLGGRTAWLREPYLDEGGYGLAVHSDEEMLQIAKHAQKIRLPIAVHAIGDRAVEQVLSIMSQVAPTNTKLRHRLIHASLLAPDLLEKLAELPIAVDIQPLFAISDRNWLSERIGDQRRKYAFLWNTLLKKGIRCAAGTDAPIEEIAPIKTIVAAQTRKAWQAEALSPEALCFAEILSLYTEGSAYAAGEEQERGKLQIGYYADFTVWDQPLETMEPQAMQRATVTHTICNGKMAYQKK